MNATDEEQAVAARVRVIYAMERLSRLLDESEPPAVLHRLPEETLDLVVSCVNAIAEVVERRLVLDSQTSQFSTKRASVRP